MKWEIQGDDLLVSPVLHLSLSQTLDCGQCFRWEEIEPGLFCGSAGNRFLKVRQEGETLLFFDTSPEEFEQFWRSYWDLDTDYGAIKAILAGDPLLKEAIVFAGGIRILRQDPWESLCSFLISQNNHIKRIRGILLRLCQLLGEPLPCGAYSFPGPERLAGLSESDLAPLRCGFRAKYLLDAARQVSQGEVDLESLRALSLEQASAELQKIKGVGPKVAQCTLLYGFSRLECVPMDVWMKRIMAKWYPKGFPQEIQPYGGIAQQYLFHYVRNHPQTLACV